MERRDTEIAISFWKEKAEQFGSPPLIAEFGPVDLEADPFRFLIIVDPDARGGRDHSVFLAYGFGLAKLFGLPERPPMWRPMIECIPCRYRPVFLSGCKDAISTVAPIRFSGEMAVLGGFESFRACFVPLKMKDEATQVLYGSFNLRLCTAAEVAERSELAGSGK